MAGNPEEEHEAPTGELMQDDGIVTVAIVLRVVPVSHDLCLVRGWAPLS